REYVARSRQAVVDAFAVGAVGDERLAPAVEGMAPGIAEAVEEDAQLHRLGSELPDAASVEPADAVRRLDVAVNIDGLVHVKHAVRAPAERVQDVVRILRAEATQDNALLVGFACAFRVGKVNQVRTVRNVDAAVAGFQAGRDEQAFGKDSSLVRPADALGVLED